MLICIVADPQTGNCQLFNEGGDPAQIRLVLQGMIDTIDQQFNNGQPPTRPSGLVIPRMPNVPMPPPPPPAPPSSLGP